MRIDGSSNYYPQTRSYGNGAAYAADPATVVSKMIDFTNTPSKADLDAATWTANDNASNAGSRATSGTRPVDFTSMTRKGLVDWMNGKIKAGEMSLDDSSPLLGLTLHIPVSGGASGFDDRQAVDFVRVVQDAIALARQRNDTGSLKTLEPALGLLQRYQGEVTGVDISV